MAQEEKREEKQREFSFDTEPVESVEDTPEEGVEGEEQEEDFFTPVVEKSKKMEIPLDMEVSDIVHYDEEGYELYFDGEVGKFRELPEEAVRSLSKENRDRYLLAYGEWKYSQEHASDPRPLPGVNVSPQYASATARLEVRNKKPGTHLCWKRSDALQQALRDGYEFADDPDLETFGNPVGGSRRISALGEDELILMKIPQDVFEARQRADAERSRRRAERAEDQAMGEIRGAGGLPYDPRKDPRFKRENFTAPIGPDGEPLPNKAD